MSVWVGTSLSFRRCLPLNVAIGRGRWVLAGLSNIRAGRCREGLHLVNLDLIIA